MVSDFYWMIADESPGLQRRKWNRNHALVCTVMFIQFYSQVHDGYVVTRSKIRWLRAWHYAGFFSTVRPTVHTNPSPKRNFTKHSSDLRNLRTSLCLVWTEIIFKNKLFKGDDLQISVWFPWQSCYWNWDTKGLSVFPSWRKITPQISTIYN